MTQQAKVLPLSTVLERDIDFILAEEFQCSEDFVRWFWGRVRGEQIAFSIHSVDEVQVRQRDHAGGVGAGETDLVVDLPISAEGRVVRTRLLIENKIAAAFQPTQPERYVARLKHAIASGECDQGWCVLVAPAEYVCGVAGCKVFDARVTYEELQAYFEQPAPPPVTPESQRRRQFRRDVFRQALTKRLSDWTPKDPGGKGTRFFRRVHELAQRIAPELKWTLTKKGPRGWVYFRSALKRRVGLTAEICLKQDRGYADIHIREWGPHVVRLRHVLGPHLDAGLSIELAGESAAIRTRIPTFSGELPFEPQQPAIVEALQTALRLQAWYDRNLPRLEELARELAVGVS